MAFDGCDVIRFALRRGRNRGIVRHENQKGFRTCADADSESQALQEESQANSVTYTFAKTKEGFADSISKSDQKQIKAQESISDARTNRISGCDRNNISESGRKADAFASGASRRRKEGLAQRKSFTG
jgi:hypothetical protein